MILHFNYEELTALRAGAQTFLEEEEMGGGAVLAPPARRGWVEELLPMLDGDIALSSLDEVRRVEAGVVAIVECLRAEMETVVVATHPADEGAVAAYFDFAHALSVAHRLGEMASEMEALIELVTGSDPTRESVHSFEFPE